VPSVLALTMYCQRASGRREGSMLQGRGWGWDGMGGQRVIELREHDLVAASADVAFGFHRPRVHV
jgi:hypothetical protein